MHGKRLRSSQFHSTSTLLLHFSIILLILSFLTPATSTAQCSRRSHAGEFGVRGGATLTAAENSSAGGAPYLGMLYRNPIGRRGFLQGELGYRQQAYSYGTFQQIFENGEVGVLYDEEVREESLTALIGGGLDIRLGRRYSLGLMAGAGVDYRLSRTSPSEVLLGIDAVNEAGRFIPSISFGVGLDIGLRRGTVLFLEGRVRTELGSPGGNLDESARQGAEFGGGVRF